MAKARVLQPAGPVPILELGVKFGSVTFGDETARVGLEVSRNNLSMSQADRNLCNRRLIAVIEADAGNDRADQPALIDAGVELSAAWDVHSFTVTKKKISFGLTCNLESIDREKLTHFPKRGGRLRVTEIADIPAKPKKAKAGDDEDDEDGDDEE